MNRPNILYLHSHDTGRCIEPYGYGVPTPRLRQLAEEGCLFRQAFCAAPSCSPSRAGLLTGQCAHSSGMVGLAHRGFFLKDYKQHLLHTLKKAGYHTGLIGVQHVAREPQVIGYDHLWGKSKLARDIAPAAVDHIRSIRKKPFFLNVGFFETHREFHECGPAEDARYCRPPAPLPDTPQNREDMARFSASARVLDQSIGAVLDALADAGLAENTLVICTTDHGVPFPSMKMNLTDHGVGVMLLMRGPGGFWGGKVFDSLVSQVDIFPTLCHLLEIEKPGWLQGRSLMPLIRGEVEAIREEVFFETNYHVWYEPQRGVRTKRWKYIRRFNDRRVVGTPHSDGGPCHEYWLDHGWAERAVDREELFDLVFDPNESRNLAGEASCRGVLGDMKTRLNAWMEATADPLLKGPVPAPEGAQTTPD